MITLSAWYHSVALIEVLSTSCRLGNAWYNYIAVILQYSDLSWCTLVDDLGTALREDFEKSSD